MFTRCSESHRIVQLVKASFRRCARRRALQNPVCGGDTLRVMIPLCLACLTI